MFVHVNNVIRLKLLYGIYMCETKVFIALCIGPCQNYSFFAAAKIKFPCRNTRQIS